MPNNVLQYGCCHLAIRGCSHNIKWLPNNKLTSSANHSTETHIYCIKVIKCRMVTLGSGELHSVVWFGTILLMFEMRKRTKHVELPVCPPRQG